MDNSKKQELQPDEMRVNVCGVDTIRKIDCIEMHRGHPGGGIAIPVMYDGELLVRGIDGSVFIVEGMLDR